jgi:hypothetical protein
MTDPTTYTTGPETRRRMKHRTGCGNPIGDVTCTNGTSALRSRGRGISWMDPLGRVCGSAGVTENRIPGRPTPNFRSELL